MQLPMFKEDAWKVFLVLPERSRKQTWKLLALSLVTGFFEILTIGSVFPIILSLTDPQRLVNVLSRYVGQVDPDLASWLARPVPVLMVFAGVVVLAGVIRITLINQSARFAQNAGAELSIQALDRILHQPYAYHLETTSTQTIALVTHKVTAVVNQVMLAMIHMVTSLVIAACVLTFLCLVNLTVSIVVLLVLLTTYLVIGAVSRRKLRELGRESADQQTLAIATVQESIGHLREMLLTGLQPFFLSHFREHAFRYRQAQAQSTAMTASKRHLVEVITLLLMAGLIYLLLQGSDQRENVLVTLGIFALAAQRLLPLVNQVYTAWANLENGRSPLRDVMEALRLTTLGVNSPMTKSLEPMIFTRDVILENVTFRHPGAVHDLFKHQSLTIRKGQRIGIMGPSGAGKTTLVDLLAGLHSTETGCLRVDGQVLPVSQIDAWQRCIGYVAQQVFLSNQTLAENIAIGIACDAMDMTRVRQAAADAGLHDWIESLPLGYQTLCGENGIRLSGGQRQRIGIARVLYASKPFLILDEPTSALDVQTEAKIMDTIMKLDPAMTIVIVTHRQSLLSRFDRVYWVEGGVIQELPQRDPGRAMEQTTAL